MKNFPIGLVPSENGQSKFMSSKRIAELTEKQHKHVLRDIRAMFDELSKTGSPKMDSNEYQTVMSDNNTTSEILLNERLSLCLGAGYSIVLRIAIIDDWARLKKEEAQTVPSYQLDNRIERAERWIIEEKERIALTQQVEANKPAVNFANSVKGSDDTILIGDLAKLIAQNGCDIGQNRLFQWMRDNGYLCKNGERYNHPTQKSIEMNLMQVTERTIQTPNGSKLQFTTKITGKGQLYFINKFVKKDVA